MHYIVVKPSETIPPIHKYHPNNTQIPDKCHPNTQIPSKLGFDHLMIYQSLGVNNIILLRGIWEYYADI